MNTLLIIALCLLASAVVQAVGFYVYSQIHNRRALKAYRKSIDGHANCPALVATINPTHQQDTREQASSPNPFSFSTKGKETNSDHVKAPVVHIHPSKISQQKAR